MIHQNAFAVRIGRELVKREDDREEKGSGGEEGNGKRKNEKREGEESV